MHCEVCSLIFDDDIYRKVTFITFSDNLSDYQNLLYVDDDDVFLKNYLLKWNYGNFFPYSDVCFKCIVNFLDKRNLSIVNYNYKNSLKDNIFNNYQNGYIVQINPTFNYNWYSDRVLTNYNDVLKKEQEIIENIISKSQE